MTPTDRRPTAGQPAQRGMAAIAALLLLAACGSSDNTSASTATTAVAATGETTAAITTVAATSTAATEPDATAATGTTGTTGAEVVSLAEAFAATLFDSQKTSLYQDYTLTNAANWSNLPNGGGPAGTRLGVSVGDLSDDQMSAFEALLAAATGSAANEGYDEIMQHLAADDYLNTVSNETIYGRENFATAFLGTPSVSGTWQFQFGGHHLAVSNTYIDGALVGATPSFRGVEPMTTFDQDGVTVVAEQQEQAAFVALLGSLTSDQLATATTTDAYTDVLLGPGSDWSFPTASTGLQGSELSDDQKALLLAAINTYVDDVSDTDAATILAKYQSELDSTYILFSGSSTSMDTQGDYVRIDGPSVWIEYSTQNVVTLESGTHPHAVWRDRVTDYGGSKS